jgi:Formate/nitrite family of transporters
MILAGVLIGIAGAVFERVSNSFAGALLFSIGLASIIKLKGELFTGIVGYPKKYNKHLIIVLLVNLGAVFLMGKLFPMDGELIRLQKPLLRAFCDAVGCGMLIYIAVEFKGFYPFICVPAFILAGFEHCIADMFYMSAHSQYDFKFLIVVILGNMAGSLLLAFLNKNKNNFYTYSIDK